ncbi:HAMP domain-containing sensor histidine kinase [Lutimonas halocynthiae]|uniref:sensor histidine kinase n=1 Tax=Lutimonas halocynthiae TaxID=1446477 RepID=UPI0025B4FD3C|nr:HAMP domain-containing sensor histidine kinase [Lutimonas halocynthiae]MDN3641319.1 HAMP domain-containing sensor histidine kinase [Lutimonas halocynthiae]
MIKRFTIQVTARIFVILLFCVLFSYFLVRNIWFSSAGMAFMILLQVYFLIRYVNNTNYSLVKFLDALKTEDYSVYFSPSKKGDSFAKVYDDFNLIIKIFKRNKIEKEAQYKYFKYILEHVNLGIISIRKDDLFKEQADSELLFLNKAACDILQQPQHKYWHRIAKNLPWFEKEVKKLSGGGKSLVDFGDDLIRKQLSLEVIEIQLLNAPYLIIAFQDIRSEIEQKEIEAWHNVIRILAHEMLNSFTPVSSLASTIKSMTEGEGGGPINLEDIDDEDIRDINMAASTIKKRSDGLLVFVKDYRTISNVPIPKLHPVNVKQFLSEIFVLMSNNAKEAKVEIKILPIPANATIRIDRKLIEQVLINLINNSIHALEGVNNPLIKISCIVEQEKTLLIVSDNGKGIEENIMNQIFIPFYTTKKNGSGIGLSLSKNIMKKHGGNLLVSSEVGVNTTFTLIFKN